MTDMTVAQTILNQLGGNKFRVMTGAKNLGASSNSLSMTLPRGAKHGINRVQITLNGTDTYDVRYMNQRGFDLIEVKESKGIYVDMLTSDFENVTGLYTNL